MAKKKVVKRRRVAPDREEEIVEEVEVEDESPSRPSNEEQRAQIEREAAVCPDCQRVSPRRCARHKPNIPV